jgi:hypothetical protein
MIPERRVALSTRTFRATKATVAPGTNEGHSTFTLEGSWKPDKRDSLPLRADRAANSGIGDGPDRAISPRNRHSILDSPSPSPSPRTNFQSRFFCIPAQSPLHNMQPDPANQGL